MKTNELRIGNYVDVVNRSGEVHLPFNIVKKIGRISFFEVDLYDYDKPFATQGLNWTVNDNDLSPIPLTEGWLEKFGLVKHGEETESYELDYTYYHQNGSDTYSLADDFGDGTITYIGACEYVHQLQNLYFALTGEELTIKP